jgi:hypothetical protein
MVQANQLNQIAEIRGQVSSNCPFPFTERTEPENSIVVDRRRMPIEIDKLLTTLRASGG